MDTDSQVGCHLNCTLQPYLCKINLKGTCLFFIQVWTLCRRSVYWIKSLSTRSYPDHWLPSNPTSHKAIPRAFVRRHTGGARLREAERRQHLNPKWLQICQSDRLYLLLTQLLIKDLRASYLIMCYSIYCMVHPHWLNHKIWFIIQYPVIIAQIRFHINFTLLSL